MSVLHFLVMLPAIEPDPLGLGGLLSNLLLLRGLLLVLGNAPAEPASRKCYIAFNKLFRI